MFWSKIWFFLVATTATLGIGVALTMPRPAERKSLDSEDERLGRARWGAEALLRENAREWIDLASDFARAPAPAGQPRLKLDAVLDDASRSDRISDGAHATARDTLQYILSQVSGAQKPELVFALDKWGRIVAGVGTTDKAVGDDLSPYFLVRDALRGYLRDDLWFEGGKLYRMAAAPVIERQRSDYVGVIVLGDEVDLPLAKALEERVGAHIAFFVRGEAVAKSDAAPINQDILAEFDQRKAELDATDAQGRPISMAPFPAASGDQQYLVALKRLPGEAGAQDGFFAVFAPRPLAVGFLGTLRGVTKDDIGFSRFPWIPVGMGFLGSLVVGMLLLWSEAERPLRRLQDDSIKLSKGDLANLTEEAHRGKFGSIARSVNIALEKLTRGAKRGKDLGAVLGPPPESDIFGAQDAQALPSRPLAGSPPLSPFAPPPISDFSFGPPPGASPAPAPLHLGSNETPSLADFHIPPPPPPSAPPPPPFAPPARASAPRPPIGGVPGLDALQAAPGSSPVSRPTAMRPAVAPPIPAAFRDAPPAPAPRPPMSPSQAPASSSNVPALDDDPFTATLDEDLAADALDEPPAPEPPRKRAVSARADFGGATVVADPSEDLLRLSADDDEGAYFREVFEDFVELKRKCGESTDGLTFERFSVKLNQNRDALVQKYACQGVKFQVYVKDGKAALKATPVKN